MKEEFNLNAYLAKGVEKIVTRAIKSSLSNPAESLFMTKFALQAKKATSKRAEFEKNGEHIPPFLIASITSKCNLHCSGCYARANNACTDALPHSQLTKDEWNKIFCEARDIGISFILLAGGEPLMRKDVIEAAAGIKEIVFPIFTNGTMLDAGYLDLFRKNRNLIPVLSIEGNKETTDRRRGDGIYKKLSHSMSAMQKEKILFAASITVTTENISEVTSDSFTQSLYKSGCRVIIYVEYVPTDEKSEELAPSDEQRIYIKNRIDYIREKQDDMLIVAFPGDERLSGGCLAAGRGFFHINSHGDAEPCPFSPYSDINVRDCSVRQALHCALFEKLKKEDILTQKHVGGCVLFENRKRVESLL